MEAIEFSGFVVQATFWILVSMAGFATLAIYGFVGVTIASMIAVAFRTAVDVRRALK